MASIALTINGNGGGLMINTLITIGLVALLCIANVLGLIIIIMAIRSFRDGLF